MIVVVKFLCNGFVNEFLAVYAESLCHGIGIEIGNSAE